MYSPVTTSMLSLLASSIPVLTILFRISDNENEAVSLLPSVASLDSMPSSAAASSVPQVMELY